MTLFKGLFKRITYLNLIIWTFFAFIALIPIQTRLVYFFPDSHIDKTFIFYNTLFLYLTDLVLVGVLIFWLVGQILGKFHVKQLPNRAIFWFFGIFLIISLVSIIVSRGEIALLSFFGLAKLFLCNLLICFILNLITVKQLFHRIFWVVSASSVFEIALGVWQYFTQKSVGLKILGEEYIRPYLSGIAKFKVPGGQRWIFDQVFGVSHETDFVMRPYGTFPHPNVFGAFLATASIVTIYLFFVSRETWKKYILGGILFAQILGLFLVYSRVAGMAWILAFLVWLTVFNMKRIKRRFELTLEERKKIKRICIFLIFSVAICAILFYPLYLERTGIVSYGTTNQEAISERLLYQKIAWNMLAAKPLTGVGFQNFVLVMDQFSPRILTVGQHQPVHNIYLLVAAETGILGMLVFLGFLGFILREAYQKGFNPVSATLFSVFVAFLFIGLFDHYLLTIQQGRLMFFTIAGLLMASAKVQDETPLPL